MGGIKSHIKTYVTFILSEFGIIVKNNHLYVGHSA